MMEWLIANLANIGVVLAVVALLSLALRKMIRDKKAGAGCCGGCSGCPHSGACCGAKAENGSQAR